MNDNASIANCGVVASVRGSGLSANDGHRVVTVGGTHCQPCIQRAKTAMRSRILQMAFSLVLGSVPIAFAQMDHDFPNVIHLAYAGRGPQSASANRYVSTAGFTNLHVTLRSAPASKGEPSPELSYSVPPNQLREEVELSQPSLTNRIRLADPALTASPQGWRVSGGGILNYTAHNQRWRLVFGYAPDLTALREHFDNLHPFSLVWQFSLGKLKPASWAGAPVGMAPAGSEFARPPMVTP